MQRKYWFLIALTVVLAVGVMFAHLQLTIYFFNTHANSKISIDADEIDRLPIFVIWLIYFSFLILLPIAHQKIISTFKTTKKKLPMIILGLEILLFFFAKIATPPDNFSTLLFFLICQPIVLTHWLSLHKKLA